MKTEALYILVYTFKSRVLIGYNYFYEHVQTVSADRKKRLRC